jgi:hypothetical protein
MAYTTDLKIGIAETIAGNPDAEYELTWRATGSYLDSESGIYMELRPQNPNTHLVITDYPVSDEASLSGGIVGIQFAITGSVREVDQIKDDLFSLFHGLEADMLGAVKVVSVFRQSGANLGQDGSGRVSRTENYYFQTHRPSKNRT